MTRASYIFFGYLPLGKSTSSKRSIKLIFGGGIKFQLNRTVCVWGGGGGGGGGEGGGGGSLAEKIQFFELKQSPYCIVSSSVPRLFVAQQNDPLLSAKLE